MHSITEKMTFHSPNGDRECEFMKESYSGEYYYSDKFSAIKRYFDNNLGEMWFILPDEGVSVYDLLECRIEAYKRRKRAGE